MVEELAQELYEKSFTDREYSKLFGKSKPSWEDSEEFNKDDYRHYAKIAIEFLRNNKVAEQQTIRDQLKQQWQRVQNANQKRARRS